MKKFSFPSLPKYRFLYISLALVVFILILESFWYLILAPLYLLYLHRNHHDLWIYIVCILVIYSISLLLFNVKHLKNTGQYEVKVTKVHYYSDYVKIEGRVGFKSVNMYLSGRDDILIGSTYQVTGQLEHPERATIPNTFDYSNYLYSNNTKYTIHVKSLEHLKTGISIHQLSSFIDHYIDTRLPQSKGYIKTFILADKSDIDQSVISDINYLGISHMFAVSGYHVGLLVLALEWIGKQLHIKTNYIHNVNVIILILYMVATGFSASVVRASMLYIGIVLNKRFSWRLSTLDILSVIFVFLLIIRPYYYYNIGFVLSFLITVVLLLSQSILSRYSAFRTICMVSLIAFMMSFPIILNNNYQINLLTIVFNIFIIYIMSFLILPFTYITFVIPLLDPILYQVYMVFERVIELLSRIDIFVINGYIPIKVGMIVIYYIIVYILVRIESNKSIIKGLLMLVVFTLLLLNINKIDYRKQTVFLDVYGDATLIKDEFDRCNILIDTGEYDEYDTVVDYLHSKQIRRLDYLIISHFHSDHYGEADDIVNTFQVTNVVTPLNANEFQGQHLKCGSLELYVYPMTYGALNENNNSVIVSIQIANQEYLFVGDAEVVREEEFLSSYDITPDYLKVGHHGSITSSSNEFIDALRPREVFIIVSRDNLHGHPHDVVIERYNERQIPVYRTDIYGTIEVTYWRGKETKKYHRP